MHYLPLPTDAAATVLTVCIENYRDKDLKARLKAASDLITAAEEAYRLAGQTKTLHTVPTATAVGGVSADEMEAVYDNKLVPKQEAGRRYYDKLRNGARGEKCPFCGQLPVSSLDHYLPKSKYPALAVTPINLVPSCFDCNFVKKALGPLTATEQLLHPYFDDVEKTPWLTGTVIEGVPPTIKFKAQPSAGFEPRLASRVVFHFETLDLNRIYAAEAANELSGIEWRYARLRKLGGPNAVRTQLLDDWESRRAHRVNSWQTAFYKALADSGWYCETVGT